MEGLRSLLSFGGSMIVDGEGIFGWLKSLFKPVDRTEELNAAIDFLYMVDEESKLCVKLLEESGIWVKFQAGDLKKAALATTEVFPEGAIITVDIFKVKRAHDHLIPVLAHEVYHVRQAFNLFGVERFCEIVARDKDLPWDRRELEIGAVKYEDALRKRMLTRFAKTFAGKLAPSRVEAQRMAARLGITNH